MLLGQSEAISEAVVDKISKTVMTHFPTWLQEMIASKKKLMLMLYLTGFQGFTWNPTGGIPSRCWEAPAVVGRCRAAFPRWSYTVSDQKWFPVDFNSAWLCTNTLHSLHDPNVFFHPLLLKISKHIKRVLSTQTGPCQGLNMIKTDWRNCIKKLSLSPHNYFKSMTASLSLVTLVSRYQ